MRHASDPVELGVAEDIGSQDADDSRPGSVISRRLFAVLAALSVLSLLAACLVNWLWGPLAANGVADIATPAGSAESTTGAGPPAESVALLPETILTFATESVQDIPGSDSVGQEALYRSLDMEIEIQRPVAIYARVERLSSSAAARERAGQLVSTYPADAGDLLLNELTVARTGRSSDGGAYVIGWTWDNHAVFVKATFSDVPPATENDFLERLAVPVAEAIDVFQRTGRQGVTR